MNKLRRNALPNGRATASFCRSFHSLAILILLSYPAVNWWAIPESSAARTSPTASQVKRPIADLPTSQDNAKKVGEIKVLAEGFHSAITHPFIAIVRDAETYAELSRLAGNLPRLDEEFFKSNAVIAAFLGERNTGGYSVDISRDIEGDMNIAEKMPEKGVMVPQVVTSPFKIVSISQERPSPLWFTLGDAWHQRMVQYRVTNGAFQMSGGFAGTRLDFGIDGAVGVLREGKLATLALSLKSMDIMPTRSVFDFATGSAKDNAITIPKLSSGSLMASPNGGLQATGTFAQPSQNLRLAFVSLPSMISDGYSGQGGIEAEPVRSSPKS